MTQRATPEVTRHVFERERSQVKSNVSAESEIMAHSHIRLYDSLPAQKVVKSLYNYNADDLQQNAMQCLLQSIAK